MVKTFPPTNFSNDYNILNIAPESQYRRQMSKSDEFLPSPSESIEGYDINSTLSHPSPDLNDSPLKPQAIEQEIISVDDSSDANSDEYVTNTDTGTGESSLREYYSDTDSNDDYNYGDDDDDEVEEDDELLLPPSPPQTPPQEMDPGKLYGLFDFSGPDPSHLELERDEPVYLVSDQDNYWWLIRKMTKQEKIDRRQRLLNEAELRNEFLPDIESIETCSDDGKIGFVPAECLETYEERLARFNCFQNEEIERFQKNPFDFDLNQQMALQEKLTKLNAQAKSPVVKTLKKKSKNVKFNSIQMYHSDEEVNTDDDLSIIRQQQKQGISHNLSHDDFSSLASEEKSVEVLSDTYNQDIPLIVKKNNGKRRGLRDTDGSPVAAEKSIVSSSGTKKHPSPPPADLPRLRSLSSSVRPLKITIPKGTRASRVSLTPETSKSNKTKDLPITPESDSIRDASPQVDIKPSTPQRVSSLSNGLKNPFAKKLIEKRLKKEERKQESKEARKKEKSLKLEKQTSLSSRVISASHGNLKHTNSLSKDFKDKLDKVPRRKISDAPRRIVNKNNGKFKAADDEEYPKVYRPIMSKFPSKDSNSIGSFSPDTLDTLPTSATGKLDSPSLKSAEKLESPAKSSESNVDASPGRNRDVSNNLSQLRRSVILDRLAKTASGSQDQLDSSTINDSIISDKSSQSLHSDMNDKSDSDQVTGKVELPKRGTLDHKRRLSHMDSLSSRKNSVDSTVHPRSIARRESADHSIRSNVSVRNGRRQSVDNSIRSLGKTDLRMNGRRESVSSSTVAEGSTLNGIQESYESFRTKVDDQSFNPRPNGKRESFTRRDSNISFTRRDSNVSKISYNSKESIINVSNRRESSFANNSMTSNGEMSMISHSTSKQSYNDDILQELASNRPGEYTPLTSVNSLSTSIASSGGSVSTISNGTMNGNVPKKEVHDMFLPILGKFDELAERLAELDDMI
jgi:hypothetical protein